MRIDHSTRDGCAIVALCGRLDLAAVPRVQQALLKRQREQPVAVVCDLSGLSVLDSVCASVFAAVARHPASSWPATGLLLCGARPAVTEVLARLRIPHFLPLLPTVDAAIDHAVARPPWLREELPLATAPTAPRAARRFVRDLCWYWRLEEPDDPDDPEERAWLADLVDRVVLVASELVTNAVLHGSGGIRLRVELRDERLHLAVHDASPRLLRRVVFDPEAERGRGLVLVEQLSTAWGAHWPADGGKVVWAVLDR